MYVRLSRGQCETKLQRNLIGWIARISTEYTNRKDSHTHTASQPRSAHSVQNKKKPNLKWNRKLHFSFSGLILAFFHLDFDFCIVPICFVIVCASRFSFSSSWILYALVACSFSLSVLVVFVFVVVVVVVVIFRVVCYAVSVLLILLRWCFHAAWFSTTLCDNKIGPHTKTYSTHFDQICAASYIPLWFGHL